MTNTTNQRGIEYMGYVIALAIIFAGLVLGFIVIRYGGFGDSISLLSDQASSI